MRQLAGRMLGEAGQAALDIADDAPGVRRQALAHRVGGLPQRLQRARQSAESRGIGDQRQQLGNRVAQTIHRPGADEAGKGLGLVGQRLQQGSQAGGGRLGQRIIGSLGELEDGDPQQAHQTLGAFGIAADPEQIVGDPAGDRALLHHRGCLRIGGGQQTLLAFRLRGKHPDILAQSAQLIGDQRGVLGEGDSPESAGHHGVAILFRHQEGPQDAGAGFQMLVDQCRRGRWLDPLMSDVAAGIGLDRLDQGRARGRFHRARKELGLSRQFGVRSCLGVRSARGGDSKARS